jgi:hypothetical protein
MLRTLSPRMLAAMVAALTTTAFGMAYTTPQAVAAERWAGYRDVKITGSGFDFGSEKLLLGEPSSAGTLSWRTIDGQPAVSLFGTLHLDGVRGACARMKLDYLSTSGVSLTTRYGGEVCANDDRHHRYSVSLEPTYASSKIGKVRVSVQRLFAASPWATVGSQTVAFGPYRKSVRITADGADFGSERFLGNAPSGSGTLTWSYEVGKVHTRLDGILHLNNIAGVCARMKIDYRGAKGVLLGSDDGETVCAHDNSHYRWRIDLGTFAHRDTVKANVRLQTRGSDDVWRNVGMSAHNFSSVGTPSRLASG